jgi:hypothetical protein
MLEQSELTMQPELGLAMYLRDGMEVKQGIRRNFARRVRSYDRHACMQRLMAGGNESGSTHPGNRLRHRLSYPANPPGQ